MRTEIESNSDEHTEKIGAELAKNLQKGDVIAFTGDLGAGKTTLIKGLCRGLGIDQQVTSPSFVIMNIYQGTVPVYHFDFYRMTQQWDMNEFDLETYFYGDGVSFVEWAERIELYLPETKKEIIIRFVEGQRNKRKLILNNFYADTGN